MTTGRDRTNLLFAARAAIAAKLQGREVPPQCLLPSGAEPPTGSGGAFVTLKTGDNLRGCIGHLISDRPILHTITEMACAAAFSDPRFPPLREEELGRINIEISRLSKFFPIRADEVEVGKHGLFLRLGHRSGLLLPQVPGEQGWDRQAFLAGLSRKSGLPNRSWENPEAILEAFTAEVFGEQEKRANAQTLKTPAR